MLKDSKTIWGMPVSVLKKHSMKYRLLLSMLYLADFSVILCITAFLYYNGISYKAYGFVVVIVAIFFHFILYSCLHPEKWMAFKFYKKYSDCEIVERRYEVDASQMHSVLYCAGYKRLRSVKQVAAYKEMFLSACCEDIKFSSSLLKYLEEYASESGSLICCIISKGKKQYFIDFKEEVENECSSVDAGDVAESGE